MSNYTDFTRLIAPPAGTTTKVRHRMRIESGPTGAFGSWYTACGSIQQGWTTDHLDVEDGERECQRCAAKAARRNRRGRR